MVGSSGMMVAWDVYDCLFAIAIVLRGRHSLCRGKTKMNPVESDTKGWLSGLREALGVIGLLIYVILVPLVVLATDGAIDEYLHPHPTNFLGGIAWVLMFFCWSFELMVLLGIAIAFHRYKRFVRWFLGIQVFFIFLMLVYVAMKLG